MDGEYKEVARMKDMWSSGTHLQEVLKNNISRIREWNFPLDNIRLFSRI